MVKTIIFDLDGVLVYTDKFHYLAWKKMADRIGVPFDETINNRLRGVSRMDSLEIILERSTRKYTQEEKEDLAEEKNGYYKEFLKKNVSCGCETRDPRNAERTSQKRISAGYWLFQQKYEIHSGADTTYG